MDAEIRTLEDIFSSPVQLMVPLYQRPYVWEQGRQWEPLWDDVRSVAERLRDLLAVGTAPRKAQDLVTAHFMGAVVLQQMHTAIGEMDRFAVIDGQQRLTTLQILVDAAQAVVAQAGDTERANLLDLLVKWMGEAVDDIDKKLRAQSLTTVLLGMLTVVAIELDRDENAQLIFETLNARNTPLLASDLVKNVLFQRIEEDEPGKSTALYEKYWRSLDADDWRKTVRQGRLVRPRLDLFLYYWLIMHTGKSVTSHEVFATIKGMLDPEGASSAAVALLTAISANAAKYDAFERVPPKSVMGTFRYRVIDVMQADAVTPVLLWLHDPTRPAIPPAQIDLALTSLESWIVRRMLCRLTTKDYNKLFLDLIGHLGSVERARAGEETRTFLLAQTADSRTWPADEAVIDALLGAEVYRTLSRARLRMVLEAVEDRLRTEYSEQNVDRGVYTIEHVLPQTWQTHWPLETEEPEAARLRSQLLHTLGNLTLVTKRLNPKLSNGAWTTKREALAAHSVLRLNHDLLTSAAGGWAEEQILERSQKLARAALAVWHRRTA